MNAYGRRMGRRTGVAAALCAALLMGTGAQAAEAKCPTKGYKKLGAAVGGAQLYSKDYVEDGERYSDGAYLCGAKQGRVIKLVDSTDATPVLLKVAGTKALVNHDDFEEETEHLDLVDLKSGKVTLLGEYDAYSSVPPAPRRAQDVYLDETGRVLWLRGYLQFFDPKSSTVQAIDGSGTGFTKPNVTLTVQRQPQGLIVTWKTPFAAARTVDVAQRIRSYDACFGGQKGTFIQATGELAVLKTAAGYLACRPNGSPAVRLGVQCGKRGMVPLQLAGAYLAYQCPAPEGTKTGIIALVSLENGATIVKQSLRRPATSVVVRADGLFAWLAGPRQGRENDPLRAQTVQLRTPDGQLKQLDEANQTSALALTGTTLTWVRRAKAKQVPVKKQAEVPAEVAPAPAARVEPQS